MINSPPKPRRYYHSSSFKVALLLSVLLGICAAILAYFLYDFGEQSFVRETEAAINSEIDFFLLSENFSQRGVILSLKEKMRRSRGVYYYYRDINGIVLSTNLSIMPDNVQPIAEGLIQFEVPRGDESRTVAAKIHTFKDGSSLLIARDIDAILDNYERLKLFVYIIMFFMLVVIIVSFGVSTFMVSRINHIGNIARQIIITGDLSRRLKVQNTWDDMSNLSITLNAFLDRIEDLMQGIRRVGDSIAHDLRTPLARIKNRLEELQVSRPKKADIMAVTSEVDHLLHTFNALLRISNIERGKRHQEFAPVDLASLVEDVIELYEPLAAERGVKLNQACDDIVAINGDRDLLFQLLANLVDNAIKFSPKRGAVTITVARNNQRVTISIADEGPGIPADKRDAVFQRFFRIDSSRNTPGSGLGLSLVKAVVDLHHGDITLEDNAPGLKISIFL